MFNLLNSNPGYAGGQGKMVATVIRRDQWMGFDGKPVTNLLTLDVPFKIFGKKSGLGLIIANDEIGFQNSFYGRIGYSYRKRLSSGELGLGIDFGTQSLGFQWEKLKPESSDAIIDNVNAKEKNRFGFDLNIGAFYQADAFYSGFSIVSLTNPAFNYEHASLYLKRHFTLTAGYELPLPIPLVVLSPSVFIKTDAATTQVEINALATYNKKFWGGVSFRTGDALIFMTGIELRNHLRIGLAYDLTTSKMQKVSKNSMEVYLSYGFDIQLGKTPEKYRSVRFL